jgi:sugar phosphate isomerase/epimerase
MDLTRRRMMQQSAALAAGALAVPMAASHAAGAGKRLWKVSLCEYSLHRMIMRAKKLDPLDFGPFTKKTFGIEGVDYWNAPFGDKAKDAAYLAEMKKRSDGAGVVGGVVLIDGEGNLGDPDDAKRAEAVERHHKWIDAAKALGCYAIRVNARSRGTYEEQLKLAADGLRRLGEYGKKNECAVIVENHGGLSSNGEWLAAVMKTVGMDEVGTLPDFGNFGQYDRYKGVRELMPYAKNVSAKSHEFDADGNETRTDYYKMMKIVVDAGFRGWVGIEYEGGKLSEVDGVKATRDLLARVHAKLSA